MAEDPVIAEIHETRERLLRENGLNQLRKEFRAIEAELRDRVVTLEPRSPIQVNRRVS